MYTVCGAPCRPHLLALPVGGLQKEATSEASRKKKLKREPYGGSPSKPSQAAYNGMLERFFGGVGSLNTMPCHMSLITLPPSSCPLRLWGPMAYSALTRSRGRLLVELYSKKFRAANNLSQRNSVPTLVCLAMRFGLLPIEWLLWLFLPTLP